MTHPAPVLVVNPRQASCPFPLQRYAHIPRFGKELAFGPGKIPDLGGLEPRTSRMCVAHANHLDSTPPCCGTGGVMVFALVVVVHPHPPMPTRSQHVNTSASAFLLLCYCMCAFLGHHHSYASTQPILLFHMAELCHCVRTHAHTHTHTHTHTLLTWMLLNF